MSDADSSPSANAQNADDLRRQAVEIVQRRKRGLAAQQALASVATPPAERVKVALDEGRHLLDAGRIAEALIRAEIVIGLAPHGTPLQAEGWILQGKARVAQGYPQAARDAFNRALHVNPVSVEARLRLAELYRASRQPRRAIPLYLEALALMREPEEMAEARLALAETYRAAGRPDAARRVVRISEEVGGLNSTQQVRAARTLLAPDGPLAVLLLLVVLAASAWVWREVGVAQAALTFLLGLVTYAALQWWRTPSV